ncbi:hypothetical protein FHR81_001167 [Actinoalloteichus hoggarensis]|uniref:ketosynthase n=1 Tax=Actinoalloteichus hoggarensis TaxID=1470176 RepID=UPI0012FD29C6|nr:ketosynthase [Actinoalloteichus hoggarensis]MBB5920137.1 hypothetical protein [Actinoalloteichus hoggarensis]
MAASSTGWSGSLEVVGASCLLPWGEAAAGLPGAAGRALPALPGFAMSRFSPLVVATARLLLTAESGASIGGGTTGIVLATLFGDSTTVDQHTRRQLRGLPHNPLFFYESVHSACVGMISIEYGISGPISCLSLRREFTVEALAAADLLLEDDAVERVVLIGAELAPTERTSAVHRRWAAEGHREPLPVDDVGVALLVRRPAADGSTASASSTRSDEGSPGSRASRGAPERPATADPGLPVPTDSQRDRLGHLAGLAAIHSALDRVHTADPTGPLLVRSTSESRRHP